MRPDQLPVTDKFFTPECDYRVIYQDLAWHLHAVLHYRRFSKRHIKKLNAAQRLLGMPMYELEDKSRNSADFEHVVIAVSSNGACYVGRSLTNTDCGDKYNRRIGFRMAVKHALEAMSRGGGVDFEIGIEPPTGRLLNQIVSAKMAQLNI